VLVVHIKEHTILKITNKENVQLARPVPKAVPLQTSPRQHLLPDPTRQLHPSKRPKKIIASISQAIKLFPPIVPIQGFKLQ
jgi:hypothetical protein